MARADLVTTDESRQELAKVRTRVARRAYLKRDASNRALRTFVQGLAIDVGVAVAVTAYAVVTSSSPIVWAAVGASLARSIVQAGASYVMRRYLDPSRIPTPVPPAPPPRT